MSHPSKSTKTSHKDETTDGKGGVKFGTAVAYDDAYAGSSGGGEDEFVTSLPTLEEERKLLMYGDDDTVRTREIEELNDIGRAPSGGRVRVSWSSFL